MGKTIVHVGPAGAGQVVKVCNQVTVAVVIEAVSEALVLGAKAGVDPAKIADVLQGGLAATKVLELRRANMLGGTFDPGFRVRLHQKDLKNALDLAREIDVALPAAAQVDQLMRAMSAAGRADYDHSGLITDARGPRRVPGRGRRGRGGDHCMTGASAESPLLRMARDTPTGWWNDSCDPTSSRPPSARRHGATSNPTIVLDVMRRDRDHWWPRVRELAGSTRLVRGGDRLGGRRRDGRPGRAVLRPVFEAHAGRNGRQTVQTNPALYRDAARMTEQAVHLAAWRPTSR